MSEFIDEYITTYNSICDKIDSDEFTSYNSFYFPINSFEDDYHNKLASWHICNKINEDYSRTRIRARMSTTRIGLVIYKLRPNLNIKHVINKIISHLNFKYELARKNKAA